MLEDVFTQGAGSLLSYGPLGLAVVGLLWYVNKLHEERKQTEVAHKAELASLIKLNQDLHNERLVEMKTNLDLAHQVRTTLDTLATELRATRNSTK